MFQEVIDIIATKASTRPRKFRYSIGVVEFFGLTFFGLLLAGESAWLVSRWWSVLPLGVGVAAFLVRDSVNAALAYGNSDASRRLFVFRLLEIACESVASDGDALPFGGKSLRCSVMLPSGVDCLKVWTAVNMDGDNDRQLEIDVTSGVAGYVYSQVHIAALVDRITYPTDTRVTIRPAHAQASVRPEMRSILCIPIFDPFTASMPLEQRSILGILCCDSDLRMAEAGFEDSYVVGLLTKVADLVAVTLARQ